MKITKQDMVSLWNALENLSKIPYPVKFSYFISKNKSLIKDEVNILNELSTPSDAYKEYDNKRAMLASELSNKDDDGNPIIQDGSYVLTENKEEFDKQLEILKGQYKQVVEETMKKQEELKTILKEDYDFDGYVIRIDDMPNEITAELMDIFIKVGIVSV